jgi:polyisoprenoid-binding protein YceI
MTDTNLETITKLPLNAGTWTIDRNHSSVSFAIRHLGVSKVRGRFADIDAELVVGPSLDACSLTATIALGSIDTGNADRDAHVRSPELLDVARRETMTFRSTKIRRDGDRYFVDGELTIGDTTGPLVLDVEFGGIETFVVDGTQHAGFEARAELRRKDFGLGFGALGAMLGDRVTIDLDVQFVEP